MIANLAKKSTDFHGNSEKIQVITVIIQKNKQFFHKIRQLFKLSDGDAVLTFTIHAETEFFDKFVHF